MQPPIQPQQPAYQQAPAQTYAQPAAQAYPPQAAVPQAADPQPAWDQSPMAAAPVAQPEVQQAPAQAAPVKSGKYTWLTNDETIVKEVTGTLGFTSPNPLLRMWVSMMTTILAICGIRAKATFLVTNKRVVLDTRNYIFWIKESGCDTTTINKAHTITSGYNSSLLIFKKRYIAVDTILVGTKRGYSQQDLETMAILINETL